MRLWSTLPPSLHLRHRHFTYVPWRATHAVTLTDFGVYYGMLKNLDSFGLLYVQKLRLFILRQSRTYNPNARGSDACRGSYSLWTRTLDRYTRAGLPECVVSTMAGPPPETTYDRTQRKHTQSQDKLKFLIPPGIEPGPPGWKAGTLPTTPRRRITKTYSK